MWKAIQDEDHPFKIRKPVIIEGDLIEVSRVSRAQRAGILDSKAFSKITKDTFKNDCIKAWNKAPSELKNSKCLSGAKTLIKNLCSLYQCRLKSANNILNETCLQF